MCRRMFAQNFQKPAQNAFFWKQNRKIRHLKKKNSTIWPNSFNFYMFLWHFRPNPVRKIFSQKICLRQKFSFRTSGYDLQSFETKMEAQACNTFKKIRKPSSDVFVKHQRHQRIGVFFKSFLWYLGQPKFKHI